MHDGGNHYDSSYNGNVREAGLTNILNQAKTTLMKRPPTPPAPDWFKDAYKAMPSPKTETQSAMSDQQIRECFIEYMKQRYPRRELTYSYTFDRFVDSAIHEMYEAYCAGVVRHVMNNPSTEGNK